MNCDKTPEMGSGIYLNGCSCSYLWNELHENMTGGIQTAGDATEDNRVDKRKQCNADCMPNDDFEAWPVGMAYVPMQLWEEPFDLMMGLRAGTIFPSLRLPFRGGGR